jgi:uncharacterized protein (DUF1330 family)
MNDVPVPAYLVVQLNVKDHEDYMQRYAAPVVAMFETVGAEVVALSPAPKVLEGKWGGNWTVVIRFPSMAVAEEWYDSADYQPLKELRINELTEGGNAVFVQGFDPAALGI